MAEKAAVIARKPEAKQKCPNICKQKPGFNSSGCSAEEILLNLQRTAGNQAVQKLIKSGALQKKNKIDQLNDICGQETNQVSGQVMQPGQAISMPELDSKIEEQEEQDKSEEKLEVSKEVSKEKPPINESVLEIEAKKHVAGAAPEAKPASEIPDETRILPGISGEILSGTATPPVASKTAAGSKEIPKEKIEAKIESPETSKKPEEATSLEEVAVEEAPSSPEDDPAFQAVVELTKKTAAKEKAHDPAKVKSAQAQAAAAIDPDKEVASKAAEGQVKKMDQATPKPFDGAAFKAELIKRIESIAPKNLEEVDEFKESGKVKSVKDEVTKQVAQSKEGSQGEIKEKATEPPDTKGIKPKSVTKLLPMEAGSRPKINASQAAPKPKAESDVSLQEGNKKIEQMMTSSGITDEMLEKSNEPSFLAAVKSKKAAQDNAAEAPLIYRKEEQSILSKSKSEMTLVAQTQVRAMHTSRQKQLTQVYMQQDSSKGKDQEKQEEVANHIQEIYNKTKKKVEAALSKLDKHVDNIFDQGAINAQQVFEDYVDIEMKRYKKRRYSGVVGKGRWVKDKVFGLPDEVNIFYKRGKELYLEIMDKVLNSIVKAVETGLTEAKSEISAGKKEVQGYVDRLPVSLKLVGKEAAQKIQSEFDNLEQSVDEKQDQLIDSLAQKYSEKVKQLDARIEEMKAENQGLVDAAINAVKGVYKAIKALGEMLLNILSSIPGVISQIISDPIGFLGNLVKAVKSGIENFIGNIKKYLSEGLIKWLLGTFAKAGIQMPESFDLKGIKNLVFQILGLNYLNIRARAVKRVGEKVVSNMEQTAGIFKTIKTEGPIAIWEDIKEKVGDFKSMILGPIEDFVITRVITGGIKWIMALLTPASAFIKAAKAIYDIVVFFVERASQVKDLVNATIDSIVFIAKGNIAVAAAKVEDALARSIPLVIGLLAALISMGDIPEKVKPIIKRIQNPIEKAIDWVVEKAVKLVKSAGKLLGFGKEKEEKHVLDERTQKEKEKDLNDALDDSAKLMDKEDASQESIELKLPDIKSMYRLTSLTLVKEPDGEYHVEGKINPKGVSPSKKLKLSKAEIDTAVSTAIIARDKAVEYQEKLSTKKEREEKTVASVAGRFFLSGWTEERPEAHFATMTAVFEAGKEREKFVSFEEQIKAEEEREETGRKTKKIEGLEYEPRRAGALDADVPGKYVASHAEKQASQFVPDQPVGVTRPMCKDCRNYFESIAKKRGKIQVVADPNKVRIFYPDGKVEER